jgi:hypothetical protein
MKRQFTAALGATGRPVRVVPQYSICDKASYYCNRGLQKWCDILDKFCLPDL